MESMIPNCCQAYVTVENSGGECAPVVPIITPALPLIRPQRVRTQPLWMKDYVKRSKRTIYEANEQFKKQTK